MANRQKKVGRNTSARYYEINYSTQAHNRGGQQRDKSDTRATHTGGEGGGGGGWGCSRRPTLRKNKQCREHGRERGVQVMKWRLPHPAQAGGCSARRIRLVPHGNLVARKQHAVQGLGGLGGLYRRVHGTPSSCTNGHLQREGRDGGDRGGGGGTGWCAGRRCRCGGGKSVCVGGGGGTNKRAGVCVCVNTVRVPVTPRPGQTFDAQPSQVTAAGYQRPRGPPESQTQGWSWG
jgi:hypothetical protein